MICVVKSKKFWGISLFEVEKLFKNKRFTKVSDRILVHMTVPLFLAGVYCNADEIKKMIVHPPGISKQYAGFVVFFSIAVFIMSLMMHELGHTMIAISRGVCVSEIGIGIKEGIFLAYTKMLQLEKLEKKKDKICICFGGILMNVFLLSVALIINGLWWESIILKIVICVNLLVTLFNFSIYFHSDGADVLKCLLASKADSNESSNVKYIVAFSAGLYNLILPVTVIVCFVLRNM